MEFPFLYHTKTILRLSRISAHRKLSTSARVRTELNTPLCDRRPTPSRQHVNPKELYFKQVQERRSRAATGEPEPDFEEKPPVMPTSTITTTEQRKFAELEQRALQQQYADQVSELDPLSTDIDRILALFPGPPQRRSEPPGDADDIHPGLTEYEPLQPSLHTLVRRGQAELDKDVNKKLSTSQDDLITKICRHLLQDYYTEFLSALNTKDLSKDVAIFEILKTRIFPLVETIGPPSYKTIYPTSPSMKTLTKAFKPASIPEKDLESDPPTEETQLPAETDLKPTTPSQHPSPPPTPLTLFTTTLKTLITTHYPLTSRTLRSKIRPLPIISRLYPSATLLALRLLTKHQPLSPVTSSLLPLIRSLGPTSYILAANTHFYNTFLLLRWNVFSSLREMCGLLEEMERGGVEFDFGTVRVLDGVREERSRDLYYYLCQEGNGHMRSVTFENSRDKEGNLEENDGMRGATWWRKREQVEWWARVEEWRGVIAKRLDEKGVEIVGREGPYGSLMAEDETVTRMAKRGREREVWL